jgi:hypothetical protein
MSHPLVGGVKVIQRAARLLGLLANSAPVPSSALCYPFYKKLSLHAEDTQISDDKTQGDYLDSSDNSYITKGLVSFGALITVW